MQTIAELVERVRRNEEIARKLFDIEVQILNVTRLCAYFERLPQLVQDTFQVEHVWLTLTNALANQPIFDALALEADQDNRNLPVRISALDYHSLTQSSREPILANERLSRYWPLVPPTVRRELGSLAILPLVREGKLLGSLNLGSVSPERYQPDKESFFLHQLAVKASLCLASVSAQEQVHFLATRDSLTLLRNRREMEETLVQELSRARRHQLPLSLVFLDCDDFKRVNDTYGHDCGDHYLRHVADRLSGLIRRSDTLFRFAGDEFVLLLPNQTRQGAEVFAARAREMLRDTPLVYQDVPVPVRLSYGVAATDDLREWTLQEILRVADQRLYQMKAL